MLFSSFWKRGPGPPLWGPGGVLGPLDPPPPGSAPDALGISAVISMRSFIRITQELMGAMPWTQTQTQTGMTCLVNPFGARLIMKTHVLTDSADMPLCVFTFMITLGFSTGIVAG